MSDEALSFSIMLSAARDYHARYVTGFDGPVTNLGLSPTFGLSHRYNWRLDWRQSK
ncbi:hypothetical protein K437DRAFT_259117 [Tilletiaria anomala UBC 951]|uniref:Uncharacterized protein n=1 Tax=Tilletiaria anomala (strain ATCC 24038 / CBS 436.72 / UBC 951) TaxID=1037660 RepID=A0A066VC58_TILAU|nr:uncharacterized protein K437DRAFT_259117 [Tilletiaria anomala UBC 951]KDN39327.1 hypothetical protein K437DRAFT_259117 [Tilletiaria anomala UBC 951]